LLHRRVGETWTNQEAEGLGLGEAGHGGGFAEVADVDGRRR
jgi:putative effector of murein hydrolase